jgi:hypothetical protein
VCAGGGEGEGEGKVVEQQTGALGNPCSSFSSSSSSQCIRRGFDKNFTLGGAVQIDPPILMVFGFLPHTECAVNKKKFEARPKLKVRGGCIGAHMCAHNVFFAKF